MFYSKEFLGKKTALGPVWQVPPSTLSDFDVPKFWLLQNAVVALVAGSGIESEGFPLGRNDLTN